MEQWMESAKKYPAWWTQGQGDCLLFRRTKMRLRSDYERYQIEKNKQQITGIPQTSIIANGHQYDTAGSLSNPAGTNDWSRGLSLGTCTDGYLSISSSALYPVSEAISGKIWNGGLRHKSLAAQELTQLETPTVSNFSLEAPNTAFEPGMFLSFDYPPDALPQLVYEPPQPVLAFQQQEVEGEHATELVRLQPEILPQTSNVNPTEFDFNDPF